MLNLKDGAAGAQAPAEEPKAAAVAAPKAQASVAENPDDARIEAPPGVSRLSVGGSEFKAVEGFFRVPRHLAAAVIAHVDGIAHAAELEAKASLAKARRELMGNSIPDWFREFMKGR